LKDVNFVVLTGLSGAGKSTVSKVLEDIGYYSVDNLPLAVISKFIEVLFDSNSEIEKASIVVDIRSYPRDEMFNFIKMLKENYGGVILFLEADEDILIRRYKETRRKHPLGEDLVESLREERGLFLNVKEIADIVINTSDMNVHSLYQTVEDYFRKTVHRSISITLQSFGFKYGLPQESDLVFDVRFLKNPYFIESLKLFSGMDTKVKDFVFSDKDTYVYVEKIKDFLGFLIPRYTKEGKKYLTVSVGCTGGRHRSVALVESIYKFLKKDNEDLIFIKHRDIDR